MITLESLTAEVSLFVITAEIFVKHGVVADIVIMVITSAYEYDCFSRWIETLHFSQRIKQNPSQQFIMQHRINVEFWTVIGNKFRKEIIDCTRLSYSSDCTESVRFTFAHIQRTCKNMLCKQISQTFRQSAQILKLFWGCQCIMVVLNQKIEELAADVCVRIPFDGQMNNGLRLVGMYNPVR